MKPQPEKIVCHTPTPGKQPTRIDRWKYDLVRKNIRDVLHTSGDGVTFKELLERVDQHISPTERKKLGSTSWYVTTVKLHMEVIGEIYRLKGSGPQRLGLQL